MDTAVEINNLTRIYTEKGLFGKKQENHALKGISFSVINGTVFGLLGPNGSGKTTTMRILSTLLMPTSGNALICGIDCVRKPSEVRKHIGLILGGDRGLYGRLTCKENLKYFAVLNNMPRETGNKRILEVLKQVGLTDAADIKVEKFSKGMKQRLHIARGILTDPEVILMDEPTIGLDPEGARELHNLVKEFTTKGKTIILTTHYMSEADELSDQIAIINKGSIIAIGTPNEVKRNFSKTIAMDIILRKDMSDIIPKITSLPGIKEVMQTKDGPVQKITIYMVPNLDIKEDINNILGIDNIEYAVIRDTTLEEAYLSIITNKIT